MNFSGLTFNSHDTIKGASIARHKFNNEWTISVITAPVGFGIHGHRESDTFEVAIVRPNGNMLKSVLCYQTPVQITSICHLLEML